MDTVINDVEEFERKLNAEVEKNFSIDIDTILAGTYKELPVAVRAAHDKYVKLLWRVYAGKGRWRAGAWDAIESAIEDEGFFIYDMTDVTAVCTYALYIEIAFLYLRDGLKKEACERLKDIVGKDVCRLARKPFDKDAQGAAVSDQDVIYYAMTISGLYMQRLEKIYPGT